MSSEAQETDECGRNADAPTRTRDGERVFAKPHEEEQDFEDFLDYVIAQEKDPSSKGEIRYAQTRTSTSPFRQTLIHP